MYVMITNVINKDGYIIIKFGYTMGNELAELTHFPKLG